MKKRILIFLLVFVLLLGVTYSAYAESATVSLLAGTLSETIANVTLTTTTLNGLDQTTTSASGSNSWTAADATGSGNGWNLTIEATDFSDGGSQAIDIDAGDQAFQIQLLDGNVGVTAGNTQPTSSVGTLTSMASGTPLKFLSAAAGDGMGTYTLAPNFSLMLPAELYAGTYTSTITVTIVSGP